MLRARKRQAAAIMVVAALNKQRKKRKCWVRPRLGRRNALGVFNTRLQEQHYVCYDHDGVVDQKLAEILLENRTSLYS